jgi:menaquinone-dependent protoporphyrinogen IX oxidase
MGVGLTLNFPAIKAMTMRALIIYPSHGGQMEQTVKRIASRMVEEGAAVDLYNVAEEPADEIAVEAYDAVIIGSPSHDGHYDARIKWCIGEYRRFLSEVPTAFFSVAHSTANGYIDGRRDKTPGADDFLAGLHWQPSMKRTFLGGKRDDRVSLRQRLMHWLTEKPGEESEISGDGDSMDREAVDEFAQRFVRFIFSCKQPPETRPRFTGWGARPKRKYSVLPERC